MEMYRDETEFMDMDMIQKVVGMLNRDRSLQRIVNFGLRGLEYTDEDDDGITRWLPPPRYHTGDIPRPSPPTPQVKESEAERNARLLEEIRKKTEKAEKKKLKKQNQKRKKQLEKEKQNLLKAEKGETDSQQSKAEDSKPVDGKQKDDTDSSVKKSTSAQDTESSDGESSGEDSNTENETFESEELDMTSTFVTKAALIAKRKMEKKPKPERKEKKVPVKESKTRQPEPDQASAACSIPTIEDHIKISTELAVIGNRFASSGDFNMAVKYFTDAIKYNPTEFKLFGNRSFCFEKMKQYEKALADAELCVNLCPGWVKGRFRKGRALAGLKRYNEAAQSFGEVLKLDGSYAEAAQELMRVQITQLMECGFTREQSSNALIIHGTVDEALVVLSKLHHHPGAFQSAAPPAPQVTNITGVSPLLSANTHHAVAAYPSQALTVKNKVIGPVQNMSNIQSQHKPAPHQATKISHENIRPPPELFPVWVGNLSHPVAESLITNLFNKAGVVYSVKVLTNKRCAFVNFTKQEHCDEAIRRFHGFDLNGMKIAVRYPDRIPHGIGISRSALKADFLQNENPWQNVYGSRPPICPHRPVPEHKDDEKN